MWPTAHLVSSCDVFTECARLHGLAGLCCTFLQCVTSGANLRQSTVKHKTADSHYLSAFWVLFCLMFAGGNLSAILSPLVLLVSARYLPSMWRAGTTQVALLFQECLATETGSPARWAAEIVVYLSGQTLDGLAVCCWCWRRQYDRVPVRLAVRHRRDDGDGRNSPAARPAATGRSSVGGGFETMSRVMTGCSSVRWTPITGWR